jgi:hypothetical protein
MPKSSLKKPTRKPIRGQFLRDTPKRAAPKAGRASAGSKSRGATLDQPHFDDPGEYGGQSGADTLWSRTSMDNPTDGEALPNVGSEDYPNGDEIITEDEDGDHPNGDIQRRLIPIPSIIADIEEQWRGRQAWHQEEKSLTLRCFAFCLRRTNGDKAAARALLAQIEDNPLADLQTGIWLGPLLESRALIGHNRKEVEKLLRGLARQLPIASWAKTIYGFGINGTGLASIIGEAGELTRYTNEADEVIERTVSKLWKHMGLAVIDGQRQRRVKGDVAEAERQAYSARRRAVMWNVGKGLIGFMGNGPRLAVNEPVETRDDLSPLQKLFVERLRYEAERNPEFILPPREKDGVLIESFTKHCKNRAQRFVEKRFLREMFNEWKRLEKAVATT